MRYQASHGPLRRSDTYGGGHLAGQEAAYGGSKKRTAARTGRRKRVRRPTRSPPTRLAARTAPTWPTRNTSPTSERLRPEHGGLGRRGLRPGLRRGGLRRPGPRRGRDAVSRTRSRAVAPCKRAESAAARREATQGDDGGAIKTKSAGVASPCARQERAAQGPGLPADAQRKRRRRTRAARRWLTGDSRRT